MPRKGVCSLHQMGGESVYSLFLLQFAAFLSLPIVLYVALALSASNLIIIRLLKYEAVYAFKHDCGEYEGKILIFPLFGLGILQVLFVLPITLILLPFAYYWLLVKMWQGVYVKFIKLYIC